MIKALQYGLGISLILVGIESLFLPLLQGVLLILLGVFVLKADSTKGAWQDVKNKVRSLRKKKD